LRKGGKKSPQRLEVRIIDQREIVTRPYVDTPVYTVVVTVQPKDRWPHTFFIPREQYTDEEILKRVRVHYRVPEEVELVLVRPPGSS